MAHKLQAFQADITPIELAAQTAVTTVRAMLDGTTSVEEVTFCCFSAADLDVYRELL